LVTSASGILVAVPEHWSVPFGEPPGTEHLAVHGVAVDGADLPCKPFVGDTVPVTGASARPRVSAESTRAALAVEGRLHRVKWICAPVVLPPHGSA
jgi:hypothetical protein